MNRALAEALLEMIARVVVTHLAGPEWDLAISRLRQVAAIVEATARIEVWLGLTLRLP